MELPELIKACAKHSITAQKYFFDRYCGDMYLLCRRYMRTNETAEEAMMNGFYQFFSHLDRFTYISDAATIGWLRKLMVHECLALLRKKEHMMMVSEMEAMEIGCDENILSTMEAAEIFRMITKLPAGYRTVFNLHVMEGMGHKEIAALLNITEGTSKSQLSKARKMLQEMITVLNTEANAGR